MTILDTGQVSGTIGLIMLYIYLQDVKVLEIGNQALESLKTTVNLVIQEVTNKEYLQLNNCIEQLNSKCVEKDALVLLVKGLETLFGSRQASESDTSLSKDPSGLMCCVPSLREVEEDRSRRSPYSLTL